MGQSSDEVACSGRRAPACPSGRLVVVGFAYSTLSVYGSPGKHVTICSVELFSECNHVRFKMPGSLQHTGSDSFAGTALTCAARFGCPEKGRFGCPEKGVQKGQCDQQISRRTIGTTHLHKKVGNPFARWVMNPGLVWNGQSISPACALLGSVCRSSTWLRFA